MTENKTQYKYIKETNVSIGKRLELNLIPNEFDIKQGKSPRVIGYVSHITKDKIYLNNKKDIDLETYLGEPYEVSRIEKIKILE